MRGVKQFRAAAIVALLALVGAANGAVKPVKSPGKTAPKPATLAVPAAPRPSALFPARDDLRWGYLDKTGKVVMSGYEEAGDFSEGLASVKMAGVYGFVDTAGKVVITPRYEGTGAFSEGLAPVRVGDLWGYADKAGTSVIQPKYAETCEFSEGLAAVKVDGKYGAIDKTGAVVIQPGYDAMGSVSEGLIAVDQGGQWGFIDKRGAVIISPQFGGAAEFSGGLAPASSGGKWGFIDKTGAWVVQPKYAAADPFSEGLACVGTTARDVLKDDEGRVMKMVDYVIRGYIDSSGNEVIPLQFRSAGAFSQGLAPVRKNDDFAFIDKTGAVVVSSPFGKSTGSFHNGLARTDIGPRYGYINDSGKMVIPQQFTEAQAFSEGLAAVEVTQYGPYGYIDSSGRWVIKPQFTQAFSFHKGLARVRGELKWGIIEKTGKYVLDQQFGDIGWVTDKVIAARPAVGKTKNLWGFYDRSGGPIIEPQFESASFLGDIQTVVKKDGKYGAVDSAGALVIPAEYDDAGWLFSEGLLPVSRGGKFGFVDATGKVVIEPQYDAVGGFTSDKLCAVRAGDKWGFIGPDNKMVIPAQFDAAVCFSEGLASVKVGDQWGFIDKAGKYVAKPQYDFAGNFNCGLAAVQVGEKWGYVDKAGKLVIPARFDRALDFDNGLASIRLGNQTGYVNAAGKTVWMTRQYPSPSASAQSPNVSRATVQIGSDGVRVVKVKAAADQVLQQRSDWQSVLQKRMHAVSDLMEKSFKIRLAVSEVVPWTTPEFKDKDDPDRYGAVIYDRLVCDVPLDDAEIVIGFTGRDSRSTTLAFTHTYFEHVIVYDPYNGDEDEEACMVRTIAHEICHDFGAFHVPDKASIMNAILYEGTEQATFDQDTTRHMDLMRDYDLAKGIDSLSDDKIRKAAEIHAVGRAPNVPFPVAKAHMYRGVNRRAAGDIAGAIRDFREAIRIDGREPDFAHVYRLGKTLLDDGQTVLGIETMRRCSSLTTDPEDAGMWHNFLGDDLAGQLGSDTAFLQCRQASRPKLGEILQRYVLTRVSPDEVLFEYRAAVKARPKDASYRFQLAEALLLGGRLDEAIAEYEQAVALEPENNWYKYGLGTAKEKLAAHQ